MLIKPNTNHISKRARKKYRKYGISATLPTELKKRFARVALTVDNLIEKIEQELNKIKGAGV